MDEKHRFGGTLGEEYDLFKLSVPHIGEFEKAIADEVTLNFKDSKAFEIKVLELGSGTGITTKFLLEADPRVHIVAVDNEKVMMNQISENIKFWQEEYRVELHLEDIFEYLKSVDDGFFDVVASGYVLHNFSQTFRNKILADIYRVLKPDGLFVNGDKYARDDASEQEKVFAEQVRRFDVYDSIGRSDYKAEWIKHYQEDERPEVVFKEGNAKKYMESLGFKNVQSTYRKMMEAVIVGTK